MHDMRIVGVTPDGSQRRYWSAYKAWMGCEPLFTTRTLKFTDTIDYIWISQTARGGLEGVLGGVPVEDKERFEAAFKPSDPEVEGRRKVASKDEAMATVMDVGEFPVTMPDEVQFPSDHLAIGCVIRLRAPASPLEEPAPEPTRVGSRD